MKKLFTLLFAFIASTTFAWASDTSVDGIWYNFDDEHLTAEVTFQGASYNENTGPNTYSGAIVIPETVVYNEKTYTVTSIGQKAFCHCSNLTSIEIPSSVTSIGNYALKGCSGLTSVTIPSNVISIGKMAFYQCAGLTSVEIPVGVTSIGESAFEQCTGLTSVTIPASVTSIGDYAFCLCAHLTSVTIPNSVISIGSAAFGNCIDMTDVYVSWLTTPPTPGEYAFYKSTGAITLHVPVGMATDYAGWGDITDIVADIPHGTCGDNLTWIYDPTTTTLTISGSDAMTDYVNDIAMPWKDYKNAITSVVLPDGLTRIGNYAFYGCTALTSVNIPESVTGIGSGAFSNCSSLGSITIPSNITILNHSTFYRCTSLTTVTFASGSTLETINSSVFGLCGNLSSIILPNTLTSIGEYAFRECTSLSSIIIPTGVTSVGKYAFMDCTSLTSITIPSSVESIGQSAFLECTGLTDLTVNWTNPSDVTLGTNIFLYVTTSGIKLHVPYGTNSTYAATAPWSGFNILNPYEGTCGDNLTWEYNPTTTTLTITGSGAMYDYAWNTIPWDSYRSSITTVSLPEGLTHIGNRAFQNCSHLNTINIPSTVKTIGGYALCQCTALTSVTLPDGLTDIGASAFSHTGLTSIEIPGSVTSIGQMAFYQSGSLAAVTVHWATPLAVGNNTFSDIASPANLHVPGGTKATYAAAEPWSGFNIVDPYEGTCGANLTYVYTPDNHTLTISGSGAMTAFSNSDAVPWSSFREDIATLVLPEGLTNIGNYAFYGCTALTSVTIPSSVTNIGQYGFKDCTSLANIYAPKKYSPNVTTNTFENIPATAILHVTLGRKSEYSSYTWGDCFGNGERVLDDIPVTGTCGADGDNLTWELNPTTHTLTISGTGAMKEYNYSSTPWNSTYYKNFINTVVIENGVTRIGDYAFSDCTALTSVTIPASVTYIDDYAFCDCTALTSVTIPSSVKKIYDYAFSRSGLVTVTFAAGSQLTYIKSNAFNGCTALTSITIPASVTEMGSSVFASCPSITTMSVDANNTVYDSRDNCNAIIKKSNNKLIAGCQNTIIPNSVTSLATSAFNKCTTLTSITIPNGVTSIPGYIFDGCSGLTSATIPASVTYIDHYAFASCSAMENMYVDWTDPSGVTMENHIFYNVPLADVNLHLPFAAWSNYEAADVWKDFKQVPMITAKADPENAGVYYNTFYHGTKAYELPAGVEAYAAALSGDELRLTKIAQAGDVLPAATAVILKSSVASYELTPSDETAVTVGENDLLGKDVSETAPANCYVLSGGVNGVGFYQYSSPKMLQAHKAYITLPSGQNNAPQRLRFVFETTTDVEQPTSDSSLKGGEKILRDGQLIIERNGVLYNAAGQEVR